MLVELLIENIKASVPLLQLGPARLEFGLRRCKALILLSQAFPLSFQFLPGRRERMFPLLDLLVSLLDGILGCLGLVLDSLLVPSRGPIPIADRFFQC